MNRMSIFSVLFVFVFACGGCGRNTSRCSDSPPPLSDNLTAEVDRETQFEVLEENSVMNTEEDIRIDLIKIGEGSFEVVFANNAQSAYLISKYLTSGFTYRIYDSNSKIIQPEMIEGEEAFAFDIKKFIEVLPGETVTAQLDLRSRVMLGAFSMAPSVAPGAVLPSTFVPMSYMEIPHRFTDLPEEYYIAVTIRYYSPLEIALANATGQGRDEISAIIPPESHFLFHIDGSNVSRMPIPACQFPR